MLEKLYIENIAVIEKADIDFYDGFNMLTGETGAGKSIIIDALSLLLGQRASRDMIRTGADKAFVSGVFNVKTFETKEQFIRMDIVPDEDDRLYIERSFRADGRGAIKINGRPISISTLKEMAPYLITIHGQHMNQRILNPATHMEYVDNFGGYSAILSDYQALYREVSAARKELFRLQKIENDKAERMDVLTFRVNELRNAKLVAGEEEELLERRNIAAHAEKMASALSDALSALSERDNSADVLLMQAETALDRIGQISEDVQKVQGSLKDIILQTEDNIAALREFRDQITSSVGMLDDIENRLAEIKRMKMKYGGSVESAIAELNKASRELEELEFSEEKLVKQQAVFQDLASRLAQKSAELTKARIQCGSDISQAIMGKLAFLEMDKCQFSVQITPSEKFTANGRDMVEFYISANPGEAPKPLAKIASGGEMSRIMLAMIQVLSEKDIAETMIFDEVDSGVSGKTAQKIGVLLKSVSRKSQVLCVTHLAQIAAMADQHYYISKHIENEKTYTAIQMLDYDGRRREVARIIGGVNITEAALQTADELMKDGQL